MKSLLFIKLYLITLTAFAQAAEKPNIILVLTDDQGYGDMSAHGHPFLKTPHLDKMKEESVGFDNFYVSPSCSPTRAALLSGIHEFRVGVTHTLPPRQFLHKEATIIPELLKPAGYSSAFIGKWHLGEGDEHSARNRGFNWWATNVGGPLQHFNVKMNRNGKGVQTEGYREDAFFNEAMLFMDESVEKGEPFFCYLCTYSPHTPLAAPEEYVEPYRGKVTDRQATYLGMVANIDYNMGRLMDYLDEKNLSENTIVIFMNDNGQTEGLDVYNANMRGCKATIWEGGSRAMSFWKWKGKWAPFTSHKLTAHLDVLPTLCEVAGVEVPDDVEKDLEGFSLLPLLESGKDISWHDDRILYHHVGRWPSGVAATQKHALCGVRQGNYLLLRSLPCDDPLCEKHQSQCTTARNVRDKGIRATTYTKNNAQYHWGVSAPNKWQLFHVKDDPGCFNDLSEVQTELAEKLANSYDAWWDETLPILLTKGGDDGDPETNKRAGKLDEKRQKKVASEQKKEQ